MDGTLMELVSRGKKDAYFIQDPRTSWFGTAHQTRSPSVKEIRYQYPESPALFNDTVDIEIPHYGDVITRIDITVDLPVWIPEELIPINRDPNLAIYSSWAALPNGIPVPATAHVTPVPPDPSTATHPPLIGYGYVDGIGDLVFKRWELYADAVKICEGFPAEFSTWYPYSQATQNTLPIRHQRGGYHHSSPYDIAAAATPPTVVCSIPIPGCQREHDTGLPICALRNQRLILRLTVRPLKELVESTVYFDSSGFPVSLPSSDSNGGPLFDPCPAPWNRRPLWIYDISADTTRFAGYSKQIWEMNHPFVAARYSVLHLDDAARKDLMGRSLNLYFQKQYAELIMLDSRNWFVGAQISRIFEIKGFFEFIVVRLQAEARRQQNKYLDLYPPQLMSQTPTEWFSNISLVINSKERLQPWDPRTMRVLANNQQLPTDVPDGQYYFMFGQLVGNEPVGNLLLTRTHKVVLNLLASALPTDPAVSTNQVNMTLLGLSWNVVDIIDGYAKVRYPD